MPRDIPIGNGSILIAFDKDYLLREFYFPHVGKESHAGRKPFRFGVWVNGQFSWIPEGWQIAKDYFNDSPVTNVELINPTLQIKILANDLVDFHQNIYLKKLVVENLSNEEKEVRLFLCHNFHIYGNDIGDTAAFRPEINCLLHYKGERYFLANIFANGKWGVNYFAIGNKTDSLEGAWKDAEDGHLSGNPIAQGAVDSVIAIYLHLQAKATESCFYWICVGENWTEVKGLDEVVKKKTPEGIFKRTVDYWKLWLDKENFNDTIFPPTIKRLYKRSLLICRTQINNCGSIIAGNDSDVIHYNQDTYSYTWPRDAALAAYALDLAGYFDVTRNFFTFCAKIIEKEGYFFHKYTPDGLIASSWHPWLKDKKPQLPIQEDETALVVWALWNHYKKYKDVEFIKPLYRPLIKHAANFMLRYRDANGLPLPSYDLWEERQGVLTFTSSAVYGGLVAAANFTNAFGETALAQEYLAGAALLRQAMDQHLYLRQEKRFARMIQFNQNGSVEVDATIDASLYGTFAFGAYSPEDEKVKSTMNQIVDKLWCKTTVGGLARYENDPYYRIRSAETVGNPWFITTLWLAQYYIALAKTKKELEKAMTLLEWVAYHALPSGVLAEQVNPTTNEPLSVSPLTWSHATFIAAVQEYYNKFLEIENAKNS